MTVKELRDALAGLPDDMPVLREYDTFIESRGAAVYRLRAAEGAFGWDAEADVPSSDTRDVLVFGPDEMGRAE